MDSVVLIVADDARQSPPQIADVLCNDNAVFPEKTADLIRRARGLASGAAASYDALRSWRLDVQFNVKKAGILEGALVAPVPVN